MVVLSPAAREVLGTLAPLPSSGPHKAGLLRRWTRLVPTEYERALRELHMAGLVTLEPSGTLWMTVRGESEAGSMFA